jgi:uncharacterized protein YeaO (DUF488 family)
MDITLKRAYEPAAQSDGTRVLVDRLWPRGVSKDHGRIDLWLKDIAPSSELRKWFNHDPAKWGTFRARYFKELEHNNTAVATLLALAGRGRITLVYGARDDRFNNAVALKDYLQREHSR